MCSVAEDEFDEVIFMKSEVPIHNLNTEDCKKCNSRKACVILRKKDAYCKECFLASTVHKFRASIGKAKLIRPGDRVLIGFSGDAASCALLNLVKTGLGESTHKKLRFEPIALYIDDGISVNFTEEERRKKKNDIHELIQFDHIPTYVTSISDVLKTDPKYTAIVEDIKIHNDLDSQIKNLFASASSLTAKQDLLKKLKQKLLLNCAAAFNCQFILVADIANKLASNLLANVSLGGGAHLSSDVGLCDSRNDKIKILRPMRDFMSDDLNYFVDFNSIRHLPHKSLASDDNPYASIQSLTKKFINDLQQNFPATISTVVRTGEKMENKTYATVSEEDVCALCLSRFDTQMIACSALQATEYSRMISNLTSSSACDAINGENNDKCGDCRCKSSGEDTPTRSEIEAFLCYSCRLIVRDVKDINLLPTPLMSSIKMKKSLLDTRNQIKDFLL